jgi:diguanylate cyclase (GGDEF)-like protein/PAS domain S-box-containing protein
VQALRPVTELEPGRPATVSVPAVVLDGLARATLAATAALVLVCDGQGSLLLANQALQRFTGRSEDQLIGRPFWEVVTLPQEAALARAAVAMVLAGQPAIPGEVDWVTGDGAQRRIELQTSVLAHDDGRPYAVAFIGIDVTVHRQREAEVQRLAMTDTLTGAANRGALFGVLAAHLDSASGTGCGLVFCDLDDFKAVNDRHGHAAGDQVLVAVTGRLRELAGPDDVVARLGGDEFVLLCPGAGAEALATRVRRFAELMEVPVDIAGTAVRVGVSTGTSVGRPGEDPDDVMVRADRGMYRMKSLRRPGRPARDGSPGALPA